MSNKGFKTKLSNIADVLQGQSPESIYYSTSEGTPFLQGNRSFGNLYPTFDTYTKRITKLAKRGDVLMSVRAPVGDLNIAPCDLCIGRGLASIREKHGNHQFIYYALKYNIKNLLKQGAATTFDSVNKDIINDFELIIPEEELMRNKATTVLSTLDSKIEMNNKINLILELLAKDIYDFWFVQFDFPNNDGKPYKTSGGKMVWNEKLKKEIPEGWKNGDVSHIGKVVGGSTPSKKNKEYFAHDGTAWITPRDLSLNTGNKFITKGEIDVSEKGIKAASLNIMPKGTVLLSSRAPIGYLAISRDSVTTNQGFKSLVPIEGYSTPFVYYSVKNLIPAIINNASGSTFKEISGSTLKTVSICIPPTSVIEKYTPYANLIFEKQSLIELENQKLAELRDWLLPMLMNGQVTVSSI